MQLGTYKAGERLLRLKQRARTSARRELVSKREYPVTQLSETVVAAPPAEDAEAEVLSLERRGAARRKLQRAELLLRRIGGFSFQVGLKDVSSSGCRVELIEPCEPGEDVITRLPKLEPLGASVRWAAGTTAGVEFARAIHPAVFDALLNRLTETEDAA